MQFTSFWYFLFLPACAGIYAVLGKRLRPGWLFTAGLVFYALFGNIWALLWCMAVTAAAARLLKPGCRWTLALFLTLDLGALFILKYLGFACGLASRLFGVQIPFTGFAAPIGLSFFTLQSAGYMIDLYRGAEHDRRPFSVLLFITFFPIVSSGPILRGDVISQLTSGERPKGVQIDEALPLFTWGLFKKLVVADRIGLLIAPVFAKPWQFGGWQIAAAAVGFTLQLYCDFSGYSDMARASALLFGVKAPENFRAPLMSRSIAEHWRRWHISLSTWFRDYLYFPLGGSRRGLVRTVINIMIVFLISGLWHGAALVYIVWGFLNGAYQAAGRITAGVRQKARSRLKLENPVWHTAQRIMCFFMTVFAFVFFRSGSVRNALMMIRRVFASPIAAEADLYSALIVLFGLIPVFVWDVSITRGRAAPPKGALKSCLVALGFAVLCMLFGLYGPGYTENSFLYFAY